MRAFFEKCEALWMQQPGPSYWLKYYYNEDQAGLFPAAAPVTLTSVRTPTTHPRIVVPMTTDTRGVALVPVTAVAPDLAV